MNNHPIVVGLDLGTTVCKAGAFEIDGTFKHQCQCFLNTERPYPAWAEQNPKKWIEAIHQVLKDLSNKLGTEKDRIAFIGVSANGPGLILTDNNFNPLANSPTWQDQRGEPLCKDLIEKIGSDWVGLGMPESSFGVKLYWASIHQSDLLRKARYVFDVKGFLLSNLTGIPVDEPSSGLDGRDRNKALFNFIGVDERKLPTMVPSTTIIGPLTEVTRLAADLPQGIQVVAGLNDGAAATLGAGLVNIGQGIVSLSTNGVMRTILSKRLDSNKLLKTSMFCYSYIDEMYITGGTTKCGGDSVKWFVDNFYREYQQNDDAAIDQLTREAESVPIGANGVMFFPYLLGMGTPKSKREAQGSFINLGRHHSRADLARALLEGVAYSIRDISETFTQLNLDWDHLRFTGGGSNNRIWRQIMADVLGKQLFGVQTDSVQGAAIIAAVSGGYFPSTNDCIAHMVKKTFTVSPQPNSVEVYESYYEHYRKVKPFLDQFLCS